MSGARALWIANGMKREMMGKPIVAIANSFTQFVPGHTHLHEIGQYVKQLIEELCECRKVGANFLLNIGPNADGSVPTMQRGTMECIGHWMKIYGKAIYNGRPFLTYTDTRDFWLRDVEDEKTAYLFRFDPGRASGDKNVSLSFDSESAASFTDIPNEILSAKWMDSDENILFEQTGSVAKFNLLGYSYGQSLCVRVAEIKFK